MLPIALLVLISFIPDLELNRYETPKATFVPIRNHR